jgi:23S rRNA (cytosine1962-C5)-methyltransferase
MNEPTTPAAADSAPDASVPPDQRPTPWVQLRYITFHSSIFPRLLGPVSPGARPGAFVSVYDKNGRRCGAGLFNPRARIPVRVLVHGADPVDEGYLERALRRAIALRRETLRLDESADAYRLINSDGDGLSGLIVDRYADVLLCGVNSLGFYERLPGWLPMLHELAGTRHARIQVEHDIASAEGIRPSLTAAISAAAPESVRVTEHGVRFEVDFAEGHKTGFFCDQRENRRRLAALCPGKRVLDLCSYTGGFGICAAKKGDAADVTGVDLDESAVAQARRNAQLNQLSTARVRWVHADAFAYARQMQRNGEQWDVVVLDPPKFVLTREPAGAAEGHRKYEDLNQLAISLVKPGGFLVTCSCSGLVSLEAFEGHVIKAAHRLGRRLQFIDSTGAGPDHPVYSNCLESRYLKVLWARVV